MARKSKDSVADAGPKTGTPRRPSGSENRRLPHGVLVRLDDVGNAWVERRSEEYDISKASVVRDLIADEIEHSGEPVIVKRKRRSSSSVPREILEVGRFIEELNRVGNNLNQAMKDIHVARKEGTIDSHLYSVMKQKILKTQIHIQSIYYAMINGIPDDDDLDDEFMVTT